MELDLVTTRSSGGRQREAEKVTGLTGRLPAQRHAGQQVAAADTHVRSVAPEAVPAVPAGDRQPGPA